MRITKRQLRRIIREEGNRELPVEFYSDGDLMSEGLLDFIGNLFGGIVDFFTGGAQAAFGDSSQHVTTSAGENITRYAKEAGEEEIKSFDDLDLKDNDEHKKIFYKSLAPVMVDLLEEAGEGLEKTKSVKDWTPKSESEEDVKAWQDENGDASLGVWDAAGTMSGMTLVYADNGISSADVSSEFQSALDDGNPAEGIQFILSTCKVLRSVWEVAGSVDAKDEASEVISSIGEVESAATTVGEAIAESGKEQQQEWVDLRRWVSSTILQEGKGSSKMRITKGQLRRIIREETVKSTEKYDDDSALKGDQDELPDALQKGIIDKTVEEREEEEKKDESIRITRRHLRRIIREALTAVNMETGEVWEAEPLGIPDKAWPNLVKRLNLNPQAGSGGVDDYDLSEEDFRKLAAETEYKQQGRSRAAESKRLDGDRITDELVTWATDAGTQFAADNPGVDTQAAAFDLAQSGRNQVSPDEWEAAVWYMFDEMGGYLVADNSYEAAEEALETMLADAAAVGGG